MIEVGFLTHLAVSVLSSFGLSIVIVEKKDSWPVSLFVNKLKIILGRLNKSLPDMLDCTVCTSFWVNLGIEMLLFFIFGYFFWPISGIITISFVWTIIELLNALDPPSPHEEDLLEKVKDAFDSEKN